MTNPTTIDNETELSAVNSILGSIGQSPITALSFTNPEISFIYNILKEVNQDVQNEGWHFNTEQHVEFTPNSDKHILISNTVLRLDVTDGYKKRLKDVIRKEGKLWDKVNHTYEFENSVLCDVVYLYAFEKLPPVFRRYITYKASGRAATQLVANSELVKLLSTQENLARASCMEYECNQGNQTIFGLPHESSYTAYQPWRTLKR